MISPQKISVRDLKVRSLLKLAAALINKLFTVPSDTPFASLPRRSLQDAYGDPSYFKAIFADFYLGDLGIPFGHQNLRTIAIHRYPCIF